MTRIGIINAILMGYIRSQRSGSNGSIIIVFNQSIICPLVWMAMAQTMCPVQQRTATCLGSHASYFRIFILFYFLLFMLKFNLQQQYENMKVFPEHEFLLHAVVQDYLTFKFCYLQLFLQIVSGPCPTSGVQTVENGSGTLSTPSHSNGSQTYLQNNLIIFALNH